MRSNEQDERGLPLVSWDDGTEARIPFLIAPFPGPQNLESPRRHAFFQIILVTEGNGTYCLDFEDFSLVPGTMVFVSPGQVHYAEHGDSLGGYRLAFSDDFLSLGPTREGVAFELAFFQSSDREPIARFDECDAADLVALIESIQSEFAQQGQRFMTVLRSYLHILLVRASRGIRSDAQPRLVSSAVATTRRFRQLVGVQVRQVRSVHAYAQQLGISPGHLHDVVKTSSGVTPSDVIQQELMLEAKRLLAHTDMSVAQVGHCLCFDDPAYFGRYFRRNQKMSPGQYRSEVRKSFWSARGESAA